jgi:hypothetical protein
MSEKATSRELIIGFVIGILTNLAWALITEQFNVYWIAGIFLGTVFVYYFGWKFIIQPLFTLKKAKVKAVYDSYDQAKPFLIQKLETASEVKILTVGGGPITDDARGKMLDILITRTRVENIKVKILLLNPSSTAAENRNKELNELNKRDFPSNSVSQTVTANTRKILERKSGIDVRYYDSKPILRLFIVDGLAFVSFYLSNKEGHDTQLTVIEKGSDLFKGFERMFDTLWENGIPPQP